MNYYELTYLASPTFTHEEVVNYHEKIKSHISKEKGVISTDQEPIKKTLAYPVKKQAQAYLASVNFEIDIENIDKLKNIIKKENSILRHLLVKKNKAQEKEDATPRKRRSLKPEKTMLKDIEQKLDEII